MKKVLITGKSSYVGKSFQAYIDKNAASEIQIDSISVRSSDWKKYDFSKYDVIIHLAAIVHRNEKQSSLEKYREINRDLTIEIAKKAKCEKVSHFIFFSSIAVYGSDKDGMINIDSSLTPVTKYGISKLEAENELKDLENDHFAVSIIRPPMIYGKNCPGNYSSLSKLANHWGVYPKVRNQRSMIYIENLAEFLRQVVNRRLSGIFLPQNDEFMDTTNLIKLIRKSHYKKMIVLSGFSGIVRFAIKKSNIVSKLYGSLRIEHSLSAPYLEYNIINQAATIARTESN